MTTSAATVQRLLRPVRALVATALLVEALAAAALLVPVLAAVAAARAALLGDPPSPGTAVVALVGATVHVVGHGAASWLLHVADNRLQLELRERVLATCATRPLEELDREGAVGLKRSVGDDVDALHHLVGHALADATGSVVLLVVGTVVLLQTSPPLAVAALAPALVAVLLQRRQTRRSVEQMERYAAASAEVDRAAVELVRVAPSLRVYDVEPHATTAVPGQVRRPFLDAARTWSAFVRSWAAAMTPTMAAQQVLLSGAGVVAVVAVALLVGGVAGVDGVTAVLVVVAVTPAVTSPLWSLAFATQDLALGTAAARRLETLVDVPAPVPASPARPSSPASAWNGREAPRVEARGLTVLRDGRRVLDAASFDVPVGLVTVVVGASGSGKSTALECLAGLVPAHEGEVLVAGAPRPAGTGWTRHVAAVVQSPGTLRASVLDNVRLGRPDLSVDACHAALASAGLASRVDRLPQGIHTVLGDGVALSGGERQRLALARALAARPRFLLLDEPTSWVDRATAARLDACVASLRGRCTVVRSDHRLGVALAADHVVVLTRGRVVEEGAPAELRARGGQFAALLAAAPATAAPGGPA
ncbi:ATP-binding cassette domain-containing protein [Nocardioides zeae]|uniref:ABC-type multidrug transport system fused ATPase/permease subunit n=1 Tax=Nocardioides zeae TaxID=1457234 RepID=A0AAJ1U127_9ACTN|nr:ABC transporter ATP-binding protein [Nocardioides zeae]MDQ1105419.1 ABC-type multidrug transport system fused ATPase/permease subunit [Nocardioides zeae]